MTSPTEIADDLLTAELGHPPPWPPPPDDADAPPDLEPARTWDTSTRGGTFVFDAPTEVPAVWGSGDEVAWAAGEPCYLVGPPGVGKSTLAGQLVKARLGVIDTLLGMPVAPDDRAVLYVAADRPAQAARSMRRQFHPDWRDLLDDRLVVWRGPLPFDLASEPDRLASMAEHYEAGTVLIDSLKDVAIELTDDRVGASVNISLQRCVADNIEVLVNHHQRKASAGNTRPRSLDDVYGSRWLTAGAGSVLLLWGSPGDAVVEIDHLKQPAADVGPLKVIHDHKSGTTNLHEQPDLLTILRATRDGLTASAAARHLFATADPDRNEIEKARRRLETLVNRDLAHRRNGQTGGPGGSEPTHYVPAETRDLPLPALEDTP